MKPKSKTEKKKPPARDGNYPTGDLPKAPQEVVKELGQRQKLSAADYELLKAEIDRAHRKINTVQDWPDHAERAHSATATVSYAKLPFFKLADKRIALSKNQPKLQKARVEKQVKGGDTLREDYRKIAANMIANSVKKILMKNLIPAVIAAAIKQGLPARAPSTVEKYLRRLNDSDL